MGIYDPYPEKSVLTDAEVAKMLGMKKTAFYEFKSNNEGFPKPLTIGKTKAGKPIKKYSKAQVLAYLELCGP